MEKVEDVVDDGGGDHEAGVDCPTDNSTQRIPRPLIKPIMELVEALIRQELGCTVVEVWIKFVDHHFIA